jgi:hypothetical protein
LRAHRERSRSESHEYAAPQPPVPLTPVCRVLRHEGREIVIEFEVPENAVDVPSAFIRGTGGQGEAVGFEVIPERSTPGGPFRKGMIVRLALKIPPEQHWPVSSPVTLSYHTRAEKPSHWMATVQLRFELPPPTATPDAG